jgi:hypothetical protein
MEVGQGPNVGCSAKGKKNSSLEQIVADVLEMTSFQMHSLSNALAMVLKNSKH